MGWGPRARGKNKIFFLRGCGDVRKLLFVLRDGVGVKESIFVVKVRAALGGRGTILNDEGVSKK